MDDRRAAVTITLQRELGIAHTDFFRVFPAVVGHRPFGRSGRCVLFQDGPRTLRICLASESQRRLGMLRIPVTALSFSFEGYTRADADRFMRRFDLHFHRGGG